MWDEPSQCYFFHNQALQPLLFGKDVMIWGAETVDGMFRCPSLRCWIWKLHQSNSINIEWDIPCDLCLCIIYYPYVICVSCAFGLYTICIDTYGHGYSEFCLCTKDIFYIHTAIDMTHIYIYISRRPSTIWNDLVQSSMGRMFFWHILKSMFRRASMNERSVSQKMPHFLERY